VDTPIEIRLTAAGYAVQGWIRWLRNEGNGLAVLGVQMINMVADD
jgi:hypothetical protein